MSRSRSVAAVVTRVTRDTWLRRYNCHAVVQALVSSRARPLLRDVRSLGCGLYPALCLLNTSCDQNITKVGGRAILR